MYSVLWTLKQIHSAAYFMYFCLHDHLSVTACACMKSHIWACGGEPTVTWVRVTSCMFDNCVRPERLQAKQTQQTTSNSTNVNASHIRNSREYDQTAQWDNIAANTRPNQPKLYSDQPQDSLRADISRVSQKRYNVILDLILHTMSRHIFYRTAHITLLLHPPPSPVLSPSLANSLSFPCLYRSVSAIQPSQGGWGQPAFSASSPPTPAGLHSK